MSVALVTPSGTTLPARAYTSTRRLRGREARGVREVVDLRLPRQRRSEPGGSGGHRRRRAGGVCATTTAGCGRCRTSAGTGRRASSPARAAARRCCAAPITAGRTARTASSAAVPEARGFDNLDREAVQASPVPGRRAVRAGVRLHERRDRAAGRLLRRPARQARARLRLAELQAGPRDPDGVRPQLEGDRRQLPRGLPHPGRPPGPAAAARLQALPGHARQEPLLDRRPAFATSPRGTTRSGCTSGCFGRCRVPRGTARTPGRTCTCGRRPSSTSTPTRSTPGSCSRRAPPHRTEARVYHSWRRSIRDRLVRRVNWRFNGKVMDEDVELCDMVQLGLESRTYERGVLNRNERRCCTSTTCCARRCRASTSRETDPRDDRWLFLTPEVEREVPGLLEAVAAGARGRRAGADRRADPARHDARDWFAYLRDCRRRLERAAAGRRAGRGAAGGGAARAVPAGAGPAR